ncbi:hypothetical protein L1887_07394 [Cichorium endivia]|nr:hypothetical protein L1887_07394 [Cichorium endivia]
MGLHSVADDAGLEIWARASWRKGPIRRRRKGEALMMVVYSTSIPARFLLTIGVVALLILRSRVAPIVTIDGFAILRILCVEQAVIKGYPNEFA